MRNTWISGFPWLKSSEGERHLNRTKTYPRSNHDMVATFTAMAALCFAIEGRWGSQSLWLYIYICQLLPVALFASSRSSWYFQRLLWCRRVFDHHIFFSEMSILLDLKPFKTPVIFSWDSYGVMPWEFCWSRCIPDKVTGGRAILPIPPHLWKPDRCWG